jgi:pimeloyl-ACP methyl ester carboxylesterase
MNYSYLIFLVWFLSLNNRSLAQDQVVWWLEGYNDDNTFWERYRNKFDSERNINSDYVDYGNIYSSDVGISGVAFDFNRRSALDNTRNSPRILIGHSLGGLVAREIVANRNQQRDLYGNGSVFVDRYAGARQIRGIVTVASPNNGSRGLTNLIGPAAHNTAEQAYKEIAAGPDLDPISIAANYTIVAILHTIRGYVYEINHIFNATCSIPFDEWSLSSNLRALLFGRLDHHRHRIANDGNVSRSMADNSPYIPVLNSQGNLVPVISIVCTENSEAPMRLAASESLERSKRIKDGLHQQKDEKYVKIKNTIQDCYSTREIMDYARALNPFYYYRARQWRKGKLYIRDQFNPDYNVLVNAVNRSVRRSRTGYKEECREVDVPPTGLTPLSSGGGSLTNLICEWVPYTHYYWETVIMKSDGMFNNEEQTAQGSIDVIEAREVNHMEGHNHENMTEALNEVFDKRGTNFFRDKK